LTTAGVGLLLVVLALPGVAQNDANPYGFSVWGYQSRITTSGVKWVRLQRDWSTIETAPGVYDFGGLDADVAAAAAAGVHVTVPFSRPATRRSRPSRRPRWLVCSASGGRTPRIFRVT